MSKRQLGKRSWCRLVRKEEPYGKKTLLGKRYDFSCQKVGMEWESAGSFPLSIRKLDSLPQSTNHCISIRKMALGVWLRDGFLLRFFCFPRTSKSTAPQPMCSSVLWLLQPCRSNHFPTPLGKRTHLTNSAWQKRPSVYPPKRLSFCNQGNFPGIWKSQQLTILAFAEVTWGRSG